MATKKGGKKGGGKKGGGKKGGGKKPTTTGGTGTKKK